MVRIAATIAAILLCAPAPAAELYPKEWTPIAVSAFGGLNLLNDSTAIGNDAQKAQNVLTDNGYLEKRPGNVILGTILAGYPVKYVTDWVSPSGTRYLIAHASDTIYQTDFSASPVALSTAQPLFNVTSVAAFARIYFADGYRAPWYWDGTSTATVVSSGGAVTAAPVCTYMAYKDSRIFCANIPSEGTSRVRISSTGGAGYWVVPSDVSEVDNAPNVFDFTPDDGDSINCMATTPWGVFVGKQYSSWMIKGTGNLSYELRILDPKVGCKDNRSVQMVYGVLQWLSNDGVYAFNGEGPPRLISRELDPLIANLPYTSYGTKFWLNDTQADWLLGNIAASGPGSPVSATIIPGSITPSSVTFVYPPNSNPLLLATTGPNNFGIPFVVTATNTWQYEADVAADSDGWTKAGNSAVVGTASGGVFWMRVAAPVSGGYYRSTATAEIVSVSSSQYVVFSASSTGADLRFGFSNTSLVMANAGAGYANVLVSRSQISYFVDTVNIYSEAITDVSLTTSQYTVVITTTGPTAYFFRNRVFKASSTCTSCTSASTIAMAINDANNSYIDFVRYSTGPAHPFRVSIATFTSGVLDTTFSTPTLGAFSIATFSLSSGVSLAHRIRTSTSPNNDMWSGYQTISTTSFTISASSRYMEYAYFLTESYSSTADGSLTAVSSITLAVLTTGYYTSAVHFIGSLITSYGIFTVSQDVPIGSSATYWVRATTYSFTDASGVNIPWTAQTANQVPTITVSTPTYFQFRGLLDFTRADAVPSFSRIQTNWNEGSGQPVSSGVIDRRYHLCLTISSTSVAPDTCLIRQKNGKWVTWTGPSIGAMGIYNYTLIAADGESSSKVWTIMVQGVYGDDGETIDSQWVSADYTNGLIFNDKVLHEMWVDAAPVSLSSVTLSYAVNKSSSYVDSEFYLDNGGGIDSSLKPEGIMQYGQINKWVPLDAGYTVGKYFKVKFSDLTTTGYWRLNSYLLYLENKARQVP